MIGLGSFFEPQIPHRGQKSLLSSWFFLTTKDIKRAESLVSFVVLSNHKRHKKSRNPCVLCGSF